MNEQLNKWIEDATGGVVESISFEGDNPVIAVRTKSGRSFKCVVEGGYHFEETV
jgi:hypothetical protein